MTKILLSLLIIISLIVSFVGAFNFSGCEERSFTVTAYYSPKSGQIFYYKPSFQDEVILNGQGYIGASGKKVFNGMLAGPATYPFGSVIYFPGLGVGEIADRGGAIVLSGERGQSADRIDIRMGNGEEGLIRALTFGKKEMTGYFCDKSIVKTSPKNSLLRDNVPVLKYFFDAAIWIQELKPGRNDIRTRTLQKYLVKLGYLNKKYRNGEYEKYTKKALCKYQVKKGIISAKSPDCGTFGKATRYMMKLDVQSKGLLPANLYATGTFDTIIDNAKYYNGKPTVVSVTPSTSNSVTVVSKPKIFLFYRAYSNGQQSSEIKTLQTFLQIQGLYSGSIDGIYSKITTNALYEFQKKYNLISDSDPLILRGYLGPKTRSKINELRQI
ncbi:MAG: peptidoglycan-binding protein [Candidatus Absconditabacterales bacterium]